MTNLVEMPTESAPVGHVGPPAHLTIEEAFLRFHQENPAVYDELRALAFRWKRRGFTRCGIKMLFEVLRYRRGMRTAGDEFKLNNNYHALYARLLMTQEPDLDGMFELRVLHAPRRQEDAA